MRKWLRNKDILESEYALSREELYSLYYSLQDMSRTQIVESLDGLRFEELVSIAHSFDILKEFPSLKETMESCLLSENSPEIDCELLAYGYAPRIMKIRDYNNSIEIERGLFWYYLEEINSAFSTFCEMVDCIPEITEWVTPYKEYNDRMKSALPRLSSFTQQLFFLTFQKKQNKPDIVSFTSVSAVASVIALFHKKESDEFLRLSAENQKRLQSITVYLANLFQKRYNKTIARVAAQKEIDKMALQDFQTNKWSDKFRLKVASNHSYYYIILNESEFHRLVKQFSNAVPFMSEDNAVKMNGILYEISQKYQICI